MILLCIIVYQCRLATGWIVVIEKFIYGFAAVIKSNLVSCLKLFRCLDKLTNIAHTFFSNNIFTMAIQKKI